MAKILWATGLLLLIQGCLCSMAQTDRGCRTWTQKGTDVCCSDCHPGNRLVRNCGPDPKDLCIPCEPGTWTKESKVNRCLPCTQCVGAHFQVKACTASRDTQCGCKEGLTCGDKDCSFCVEKCGKGQEPTQDRSCRPCPAGTFNDQIHQMCKRWSTKCPGPDQHIMTKGNAVSDITCANLTVGSIKNPNPVHPGTTEQAWPLVLSVVTSIALMGFGIIIIVSVAVKNLEKRKKKQRENRKTPIIRVPTDAPMTLVAVECSFHEAQQEQGSSSESLVSKDSSDQLIA